MQFLDEDAMMRLNSLNMMVSVASWIKRWFDLSEPRPWEEPKVTCYIDEEQVDCDTWEYINETKEQ